jgi:RNA polymerase sigma-70 factor (ECF subfamily)
MDRHELERKIQDETIEPQEKYKCLWEYYYPRLLIYLKSFKKMPNPERHDVVSDILLKIFNNVHKYNQAYSLSTWVYTIAKNHVLDLYREYGKLNGLVSNEEIDERTTSDNENFIDEIIRKDIAEECRRCIESLDEKYKRLVFLRYYEGLNSKEIAVIEGVPHSTIRQRLMAIRARLKELLGDYYEH